MSREVPNNNNNNQHNNNNNPAIQIAYVLKELEQEDSFLSKLQTKIEEQLRNLQYEQCILNLKMTELTDQRLKKETDPQQQSQQQQYYSYSEHAMGYSDDLNNLDNNSE